MATSSGNSFSAASSPSIVKSIGLASFGTLKTRRLGPESLERIFGVAFVGVSGGFPESESVDSTGIGSGIATSKSACSSMLWGGKVTTMYASSAGLPRTSVTFPVSLSVMRFRFLKLKCKTNRSRGLITSISNLIGKIGGFLVIFSVITRSLTRLTFSTCFFTG